MFLGMEPLRTEFASVPEVSTLALFLWLRSTVLSLFTFALPKRKSAKRNSVTGLSPALESDGRRSGSAGNIMYSSRKLRPPSKP